MRYIASCITALSALALIGPACADEYHPPKKARPAVERAAPERQAPAQQQSANWNGSQLGGSNGASGVNNNFVEPGAYLFSGCSIPGSSSSSSFGSPTCAETPFSFSSNTNWRYTAGGFVGWRQQVGFGKGVFPGGLVVGIEGDQAVVEATASDSLVRLTAASFSVNGKKWVNVFPTDFGAHNPALQAAAFAAPQNYLPYPQFGSINYMSNTGHSSWHAGTVQFVKRYSQGVVLNAFYTFSQALDDCADILAGRHDDLPVEAFYFGGSMYELRARRTSS